MTQSIIVFNSKTLSMSNLDSSVVLHYIKQEYAEYNIWEEYQEYKYFCVPHSTKSNPLPKFISVRTNEPDVSIEAKVVDFRDKNVEIVPATRNFSAGLQKLKLSLICKNYDLNPGDTFHYSVLLENITSKPNEILTFNWKIFSNLEYDFILKDNRNRTIQKKQRIFLKQNIVYSLEIIFKIPDDFKFPYAQTPILSIWNDNPDSKIKQIICMKKPYISIRGNLLQNSSTFILENGDNVWDKKKRYTVKVPPLCIAGKGHLHTNTGRF